MTVSLVDYGLGNLGSVANMFKRLGVETRFVSTPEEIAASERLLLPGIGAFDHGMARLQDQGLDHALKEFAATGRPFLGICLGMQLLLDSSEEGSMSGLKLIPGASRRFATGSALRIPHMGWNSLAALRSDPLLDGVEHGARFYFVHSYHVVPADSDDALGTTPYGEDFVSVIRHANVMGAQFHPEKSHAFGMRMLGNFAEL